MVSFATAALPFKQLMPPISASVTNTPALTCSCSSSNNLLKTINVNPTKVSFGLPAVVASLKLRLILGVALNRVASLPNNQVFWEDPDDGSGSEYDEDDDDDAGEKIEENNLDFESNWEEEERVSSATASSYGSNKSSTEMDKYEEDLLKVLAEVEQLLGPEERALWQQNAAPNLGKLSMAKWSPLHSLALAGQIREMDMLLGNGLDIDLVDKDGLTALHMATIGKKEAVISHLLRKGANPNVRDQDGASPLHYAVQVGALQTVKLLIKFNVDLNSADNEGWTPLHIAIQSRNRDIAKVLLVNGADKTRRNQEGKTPLDLALCYGNDFKSYDLAKLLKLVPANRDL